MKAILTIEDVDGEVNAVLSFDPPATSDDDVTPAVYMALQAFQVIQNGGELCDE
jgi:hypothetical protein